MAQRTLTFTKKPKDLSKAETNYANRVRVGSGKDSLVFTIKHFMEIPGHDDSLPYIGTLYVNNTPLCKLHNDGWGGETEITSLVAPQVIDKVIAYVEQYAWTWKEQTKQKFTLKLDFIADTIASTLATEN